MGNSLSDTDSIRLLLSNIANYNANEQRQNIPYPGNFASAVGAATSNYGYVNSNSWALTVLEHSGIVPAQTNVPGRDAFSNNRIDTDYFDSPTTTPVSDLARENIDTDGDGWLDVIDRDPLVYDGTIEGRLP